MGTDLHKIVLVVNFFLNSLNIKVHKNTCQLLEKYSVCFWTPCGLKIYLIVSKRSRSDQCKRRDEIPSSPDHAEFEESKEKNCKTDNEISILGHAYHLLLPFPNV